MTKSKNEKNNNNFMDRQTPPIAKIILDTKNNRSFQAGMRAAQQNKDRDETKGLDWILGYDSVVQD